MKQFSKTEYCISQSLVTLFILVILTNSETYHGKVQMNAMPEHKDTNAKSNTTIESAIKPTENEQSFRQETEKTSLSTRFNTTTTSPINRTDRLMIENITIASNVNQKFDCESEINEPITSPRVKCDDQKENKTNLSVDDPSFTSFNPDLVAAGIFFVGGIVVILNLFVIVVAYSSKKLRQDTYLNLILTLSVNDFLFGLSTTITVIRRLSNIFSTSRELCIFSNIISPICLVMTLYQSLLISLHRYLVVTGSDWSKNLFKQKRNYIWYLAGWAMLVPPVSALISPDSDEFDIVCTVDTVFSENKSIVMCIIAVSEFILILLILVFYCMTICSLKRHFLNMSNSSMSKTILENSQKKFLKSMKSVNRLLLALLIFSGPFLVRNFIEIFMPLSKPVLFVTYALTNINSMVNPFIYFTNLLEFKTAIRRLCFLSSQTSEST